jgi:hypothetical protein
MNITSNFTHAVMLSIAKHIARMAQTDKQEAANYFDMHAASMSEAEREQFGNAFLDAAIELAA